ncbi:MAG: hypothetical protein ACYCX3_11865 [Thermoleophilia bacterium]
MFPPSFIKGLAMIFLGSGALGSVDIALYFREPFLALGYLLGALTFIGVGITRLVRVF